MYSKISKNAGEMSSYTYCTSIKLCTLLESTVTTQVFATMGQCDWRNRIEILAEAILTIDLYLYLYRSCTNTKITIVLGRLLPFNYYVQY